MENQEIINNITKLIGTNINNYTITKYINSGSFGDVFEGKNNLFHILPGINEINIIDRATITETTNTGCLVCIRGNFIIQIIQLIFIK